MDKLSATYKGLIVGVLMVLVSVAIFYSKGSFESNLQYITYALYIFGIVWTLRSYYKNNAEPKSFKNYFSQGFKFFIVVCFLMVIFTYAFTKMHPELKEAMAVKYRAELVEKGNYTPVEINNMVQKATDFFTVMLTSLAIFWYLVMGSMVTVITTLFFLKRDRQVKY